MSSESFKKRTSSSSRLRMDNYTPSRSSRVKTSPPKRRELDNVMKKARKEGSSQSNYWNKKLLEVEEKDPNRWRHSGFKELYGGNSSPQSSNTTKQRSRSRSRGYRRSRSKTFGRARSRSRSTSRFKERRPHTPTMRPLTIRPNSSRRSPRSPRPKSTSPSTRSVTSCSDESCSVCSPKSNRRIVSQGPVAVNRVRPRVSRISTRSFSVVRNRPSRSRRMRSGPPVDPRGPPPSPPPALSKALKIKRKEKRTSKKEKEPASVPIPASSALKPRPELPSSVASSSTTKRRRTDIHVPEVNVTRRRPSPTGSGSDDSSTSSVTSGGGGPQLTLSERFGKMAQWSVDRRDLDGVKNLRITKNSDNSDLKVVIEGDRYPQSSPGLSLTDRRLGIGCYSDSLHAGPMGLDCWDDVRVRYKYYKERGYLGNLTLDDYIEWEEWWYKYQEWLDNESYYEQWWSHQNIRKHRRI